MLELREKEILRMLEKLKALNFVLIGGYAINAYTHPRFSVDCDIVVLNKEDAGRLKNMLAEEGYKEKANPGIPYSGQFLCPVKKIGGYSVPFDILIGSVVDRKTNSKFKAEWIFKNSRIRALTGKAHPARIELRIANPEILVIMKLAAGRKADFRDIFMLFGENIDMGYILHELKEYKLQNKLKKFKEYAMSKEFRDSLQGVFGKIDEKVFNKVLEKIKSFEN